MRAGSYRDDLLIMKGQEIVWRLRQNTWLWVLPGPIVTSARKYSENGAFRLQGAFMLVVGL
jgi:hypothetical protein